MPTKNTGFTLIEVLIAMMVLAVGLLGLAAMQAYSLKNNQSAHYRSQATQLAYDIADRMRVNVESTGTYTGIDPAKANPKNTCLTKTGCSKTDMAEHDLWEWNKAIQANILPQASGKIVSAATGNVTTYTVTIDWDENRDDNRNKKADGKTSFDMSFRL